MSNQSLVNRVNRLYAVLDARENSGSTPAWAMQQARKEFSEKLAWQQSPEGQAFFERSNKVWKDLLGGEGPAYKTVDLTAEQVEERIAESAARIAKFDNLEAYLEEIDRWDRQWAINRGHLQDAIARDESRQKKLENGTNVPKTESNRNQHLAESARTPVVPEQSLPSKPSSWPEPVPQFEPEFEGDV
jgi:hypothetical protein